MSGKVLLIGLDGADPEFIQRHLSQLPTLRRLISSGTWGRLRSTIPPVTSPAWATAMSGMNPGKTHTSGFVRSDFASSIQELIDSRSVAVPRIWNVLSHLEKRVAVVGVPLTYPPEQINGVMVSGFLTPSTENIFTFPPELSGELAEHGYRLHVTQGEYEYREKKRFLEDLYRSSSLKFDLVLRLLRQESWDCFIFVISETDWIQHFFDREEDDPEHQANEQIILEYFRYVDKFLAQMIALAGEDSYVVLMSDHGFGRFLKANVHLNTWLLDQGYLSVRKRLPTSMRHWLGSRLRSVAHLPGFRFLKKNMPLRVKAVSLQFTKVSRDDIDWQKTKAYFYNVFASTGCIRVNRGAFSEEHEYEEFRRELADALRNLEDPVRRCKLISEIYLREELYSGPHTHEEPDIIFLFEDGYGGQDTVAPSLVMDIPRGGAPGPGHRLDGIWALWGPGIRAGQKLNARIEDIAPTVYHLLNVSLPSGVDGQVLSQAFACDSGLNREVRYVDYNISRHFVGNVVTPDEEKLVLERLKNLGYMD